MPRYQPGMGRKMNSTSLAFIWCLMACVLPGLKGYHLEQQEENNTVVLPCGPPMKDFKDRFWYSGYFNLMKPPTDDDPLFEQIHKDCVEKNTERKDMFADGDNFNLIIEHVTLKDAQHFTCKIRIKDSPALYNHVKLEVYIQPEITLVVFPEKKIYTEDDNVTAICTIRRVYPELTKDTFFMKWDTSIHVHPQENHTSNADGSLTYKINFTKTVSNDDTSVYCLVEPERGRKWFEKWDFTVQSFPDAPEGRPSILFTLQSPMQGDLITFLCDTKNVTAHVISSVTWYRNGSLLDWESPGCCAYTKRADIGDTGTYSCMVGNALGSTARSEPRYLDVINPRVAAKTFTEGSMVGGVIGGLIGGVLITCAAIFLYQRWKRLKENTSLGSNDVVGENNYMEPLPTPNIGGTATRSVPLSSEDVYAQVNKPNKNMWLPPSDLHTSEGLVKGRNSSKKRKTDSLMIQENYVYGLNFSELQAQETN